MKPMTYLRILLAVLLLACCTPAVPRVFAQEAAPHADATQTAHEAEQGEEAHGGGWLPVVAKAFNFAILAGVLVYFLKTPLTAYLDGRITQVRALPGEIEQLKTRGAEDLAAERARIDAAADADRQRLLEHTRREIDMRVQVARRELVEHAADLAVQVAASRIKQTITPEDQSRLVDRYAAQIGGGDR
jgi:F0F1-type ATP synthase membrane subunit b/b'